MFQKYIYVYLDPEVNWPLKRTEVNMNRNDQVKFRYNITSLTDTGSIFWILLLVAGQADRHAWSHKTECSDLYIGFKVSVGLLQAAIPIFTNKFKVSLTRTNYFIRKHRPSVLDVFGACEDQQKKHVPPSLNSYN
jgi:hypothetical protein